MAEFAAANTSSMVLFVGNPTNVVICEGFSVNNAAFTAYTIFPFLACTVTCFIALAIQFRDKKYISRKFSVATSLNVRAALRDPVGAWVGSILLGTCLAVIIVVSFFKIDVWKISVPFAVAKLAFDLAWDFYRYRRNRSSGSQKPSTGQPSEDPMESELKRAMSLPNEAALDALNSASENNTVNSSLPMTNSSPSSTPYSNSPDNSVNSSPPTTKPSLPSTLQPASSDASGSSDSRFSWMSKHENFFKGFQSSFVSYFPTVSTALPRLPFGLIPFAFSQFILIEALNRQGWIDVFAHWLMKTTGGDIYPTVWIIGVVGVLLCNVAGTNIGATIMLTKIVRAASFTGPSTRAAAIALAVASNIGAVSFTFSASLAGLLWNSILLQKGITVKQRQFAFWNLLPLVVMTTVGLAVVSAEMAVLYPGIR